MDSINQYFRETAKKLSEMYMLTESASEESNKKGKLSVFEEALKLIELRSEYQNVQFRELVLSLETFINSKDKIESQFTANQQVDFLQMPQFNGIRMKENKKRYFIEIETENEANLNTNEMTGYGPQIEETRAIFQFKKHRL